MRAEKRKKAPFILGDEKVLISYSTLSNAISSWPTTISSMLDILYINILCLSTQANPNPTDRMRVDLG